MVEVVHPRSTLGQGGGQQVLLDMSCYALPGRSTSDAVGRGPQSGP